MAVHSSKDLPGELPAGLAIAGYLPREDPRDVLVLRAGVAAPRTIATGSPRRRLQIAPAVPGVAFTEIRGNVDTRLQEDRRAARRRRAPCWRPPASSGWASRSWPGVEFHPLGFEQNGAGGGAGGHRRAVPRGGRGALRRRPSTPPRRARSRLERALQRRARRRLPHRLRRARDGRHAVLLPRKTGPRTLPLTPEDFDRPVNAVERILQALGLADQ